MNKLVESSLTSILIVIFATASFVVALVMPIFLSNTYHANNFTFDVWLCARLLDLYGSSLVCVTALAVGSLIRDLVCIFKGEPIDEL